MKVLSWPLKTNSNWRIALVLTSVLGIVGLFYIVILLTSPPPIVPAPGWPIVDKRWLVALCGLGVSLVYFPLVAKEIAIYYHLYHHPQGIAGWASRQCLMSGSN